MSASADTPLMSRPLASAPAPRVRPAFAPAFAPVFAVASTALIVVIALASAVLLWRADDHSREEATLRLTSGLQRSRAAIRAWETQALARTSTWAADPAVVASGTTLAPTLGSYARGPAAGDGVRAVALFSLDGTLLASSSPALLSDPTIGQRLQAVARARAGTASVAGPIWPTRTRESNPSGEWLLLSAAPVRDAAGQVALVLAFFHGAEAPLRTARLAMQGERGATTYLLGADGEVLSSTGPVDAAVRGPVGAVVAKRRSGIPTRGSTDGMSTRAYEGAEGNDVVGAWTSADPIDARVVYETPMSAAAGGLLPSPEMLLAGGLVLVALLAIAQAVALRRSTARSRDDEAESAVVIASAPNAVLVCDAQGVVRRTNAKAAALLDASPEEIAGSTIDRWLQAGTPLRPDRLASWLDAAARDGIALRDDRSTVPVEVRSGHGTLPGGAIHVVVLLDRAEQRGAARAAQEAKAEATKARERQGELVSVMHQELRTPMSRVLGMVHLLKDTTLSPVQQGYVESMMRSAQTMMTFVTDVLDLAKIEQGTLQLIEAPFEVRTMLSEIGELCAPQAEATGTVLQTRVTDRTPAWLMGDAARLRQVLINLIGNGIKFAPNGAVEVKVDGEPLSDDVSLHVRVIDNGPGMDNETMRRLFAKDPTTVSKLAGGGLGISMAKHLVELMGGKLEVKSLQGDGSTFHFKVRLRTTEGASGPDAKARAALAGTRALVVDRSPQELSVTREWLRSWGMRVETTSTPEEAIGHLRRAAAEGDPVEVALVDRLTVGDQADAFARRMRAEPAIAGTGLLISQSGPTTDADKLASAGADAVLAKPFGAQALSRTLAAVVERPHAERGSGKLVRPEGLISQTVRAPQERPHDGQIHIVEEPSAPRRVRPTPLPDGRLRVLLAEDNRVNQIVATNLLQRLGCRVEVVRDGTEAVRAAARQEFDVILMDIQMPNLDGPGATALIRRLPPPNNGPHIIAMGTSASPDEHDRYIASGMNDVVVKPLTPEGVQAALERRPAGLEPVAD